jgi:hypothetical protein
MSDSRASEIMRGKRKLTLEMVRTLHERLHIPSIVWWGDIEIYHVRTIGENNALPLSIVPLRYKF